MSATNEQEFLCLLCLLGSFLNWQGIRMHGYNDISEVRETQNFRISLLAICLLILIGSLTMSLQTVLAQDITSLSTTEVDPSDFDSLFDKGVDLYNISHSLKCLSKISLRIVPWYNLSSFGVHFQGYHYY